MRHIPEAGAVCGNSARTDLRGGQGVTSVPTATQKHSECSSSVCQRRSRIRQSGSHAAKAVAFDHSRVGHGGAQRLHEWAQCG